MSPSKTEAPAFDKERVHVFRSSDPEAQREWFRAALKALAKVKTKEVIAIKPNLGSPLPDATGATTALWMIEETINWVRKRRAKPIIVEAPSHIHDYDQVLDVTGARDLFKRLNVEYVDARTNTMQLRPLKHDSAKGRIYKVHMAALSADGIICLPKLKTHNRTSVTLGIKGMMGLLGVSDRHGFHRRGVTDDIVELYKRLRHRVRATFIDGVIAMEGHGPTGGSPVDMNVIVGGQDMVSGDAVAAEMMGFESDDVHHIRIAHEQQLGNRKRGYVMHPAGLPLPVRPFERARADNGVRTQVITFPPLSAALRATRMGVRGRTKPVVRAGMSGQRSQAAADVCPTGAITADLRIDYPKCIGCGLCIEACPTALEPEGRRHKLSRVFSELVGG